MHKERSARSTRATAWYFGWNIVVASAVVTLLTVGMRMGIGPFVLPMTKDLGFGRSLLSAIVAVGMLSYGIAMPLAGYLVAKLQTRTVLLAGTAIVVLSAIGTVFSHDPGSFGFSYGIAMSLGLGLCSPVALTPIISKWFTRRRGMALFFLATGSMAGIAVMTPLFMMLIEHIGWRHTILCYAFFFAVVNVPVAVFIMKDDPPPQTDQLAGQREENRATAAASTSPMSIREVLGTAPFWQIAIGLFVCGISMNLLGTHAVPMLMDHGFGATVSSLGVGLIGLVAIFSTLLLGQLSDRLERRDILAVIYLVRGLGFIALVAVHTPGELYAAAAIGGLAWSGSVAMSSAILADQYGVRLVGYLYGWAYLGHQVGAMLSAWFGGWAYETFGSHWPAFGGTTVLLLMAAAISKRLPARGTPAQLDSIRRRVQHE
ncbi:MFS transporter [Paraburkholderia pallida]|uniref:MFS transporter n=1 Tax=Paraburkholderia pallida TaxID=2547399 RepID=A0A4P7D6D1_9BURK|nr:MFS transporter [Paraburkholderia pallida]QBR02214.1 MFS transporter [Paraburkholderia pallida]